MKTSLLETQKDFESSMGKTTEYLSWHRLFKREFTKFLTEQGATVIQIWKPNHFDISGFFQMGNGQQWYFSIGDLRGFKNDMLVRTVKSFKDYSGGQNHYISLCFGEDKFRTEFQSVIINQNP